MNNTYLQTWIKKTGLVRNIAPIKTGLKKVHYHN